MIVEMRTYTLKPGSTKQFEDNFEKGLPARLQLSRLGAFWHTEVGTLNQVIHLWPYKDIAERDSVRQAAYKLPGWPPDIRPFVEHMEAKILVPAEYSPPLEERRVGPLFEISTFTYSLGSIPSVMQAWGEKIEARMAMSPLVGAWRSEIGPLNQWIHIWGYRDAGERQRIRAESVANGVWPPKLPADAKILRQESILAMPSSFSPVR
ncbi:NIPSNAP family protein [Bradyrhizobium sp. WYCCWR 13022]|uniref:NIPSNAP family protein n=1 Tax=unclassified Bradyrhizobium TaxID=2631580 RepID=UPI00263BD004|nr:NIPSNAP family protein [Bradyrhizobium sp. WYCCWR 13022]MDN4984309.1 NIPSNAP family protein [Bradyrhizobium sp. WYCCWR 13022]